MLTETMPTSLGTRSTSELHSWVRRNQRHPEIPLISTKTNCNSNLPIEKVKNRLEKGENILRKKELVNDTGCFICKKTAWKNKNWPEGKHQHLLAIPGENQKLTAFIGCWSGGILCLLISLWYKNNLIFIQNEASLSEHFLCSTYFSFLKQAELSAQTVQEILNPCWGRFGLSSHFWDGWMPCGISLSSPLGWFGNSSDLSNKPDSDITVNI